MRSILFLSDSVNRRFMSLYHESGMKLPNIERLAQHSAVFDNHWVASAPCIPARRDIMTGRINFLERNWGPIEPFDHTLPQILRTRGVSSRIITDHYHYFEIGSEGYCQMFDSWDMIRGQEWDPWISMVQKKDIPDHLGKIVPQYWYNRCEFANDESKYPSAVTIQNAADWLEENHNQDNFLLWVEPFDPHEPFDVPQCYLDEVEDRYNGTLYLWPDYKLASDISPDPESLEHIRKRYLALLLMTDHWLGKLLDVMDRHDMWQDTAFIYTTDHGYMLGEHGYMAKNYMAAFNEIFHIPLLVHLPQDQGAGMRINALTQNIDILPTLMELHGVAPEVCRNPLHGKSWLPLIRNEAETLRDYALYGYFGKQVNITDGRYTYFHSPNAENRPLNLYTSMMTDIRVYFDESRLTDPTQITSGCHLPWVNYPVFKIPADIVTDKDEGTLRYVRLFDWEKQDQLYDLKTDYEQARNLVDSCPEALKQMKQALRSELIRHDAPAEQLTRLNLREEY